MRELVAFVARLHDPLLVVKYLRGKREKKWREVCTTEKERDRLSSGITNGVPLDFLDSKEEREICDARFFS